MSNFCIGLIELVADSKNNEELPVIPLSLDFVNNDPSLFSPLWSLQITPNSFKQPRFRNMAEFFPVIYMNISSSDSDLASKL